MITVTCIYKHEDTTGKITGYKLQDAEGHTVDVTSQQLKDKMKLNQIYVTNLRLASNGRIVDINKNSSNKNKQSKKSTALDGLITALIYMDYCTVDDMTDGCWVNYVTNICGTVGVGVNINKLSDSKYTTDILTQAYSIYLRDLSGINLFLNSRIESYQESAMSLRAQLQYDERARKRVLKALSIITEFTEYCVNNYNLDTNVLVKISTLMGVLS